MDIPVGLVFFFSSSVLRRTVAFYPGPAGVAESELGLQAWSEVVAANPEFDVLADDVEALLVRAPNSDHGAACSWYRSTPATSSPAGCVRCGEVSTAVRTPAQPSREFFASVAARSKPWRGFDNLCAQYARTSRSARIMIDLAFRIDDVVVDRYAAAPQLTARIQIDERSGAQVHAIALRCQINIEPQRRAYQPGDRRPDRPIRGPGALVADPQAVPWMQCTPWCKASSAPRLIELPMPVTYDLEVTASKYLHQLDGEEVPLRFMFSGTCFTRGETGFGVEQVPWHLEDAYRMPVAVWRACMDLHFPGTGWLRLDRDTLAALTPTRPSTA